MAQPPLGHLIQSLGDGTRLDLGCCEVATIKGLHEQHVQDCPKVVWWCGVDVTLEAYLHVEVPISIEWNHTFWLLTHPLPHTPKQIIQLVIVVIILIVFSNWLPIFYGVHDFPSLNL